MKKDQIKGRIKTIKGETKEAVGKLIGDKELEAEGKAQKGIGKIQSTYGDLTNDIEKKD